MNSNSEKPAAKQDAKSSSNPKISHAEARQRRLEEQLRANLKKRKDQVRSRAAVDQTESDDANEDGPPHRP